MLARALLLCTGAALPGASTAAHAWMSPDAPVSQRVEALLAEMSMTDKLWQLRRPDWDPSLPSTGVGILEFPSLTAGAGNATQVARNRNAVQRAVLSSGPGARLGIPAAFRLFSIHGAEAFGVTFPEGPGLGATWDPALLVRVGAAIAQEGRALGADMFLPVVNLWSDARFGRQEEGFSEEPTLTASFAAALVEGAHGTLGLPIDAYLDNTTATLSTVFKHVGAYGAAAGGMNGARADLPEHTVREVYLKPWRRAAVSGARGVMPSHNTVLKVPAHGSPWLLRDRLRVDFNMSKGLFISDTGDVLALRAFRLCAYDASCAALALNAGVDVEQVPGETFLSLPTALALNLTTQAAVDDAVRHVLTHKFATRLFDQPFVDETLAGRVMNSPAHRALAQEAAEEGTVLLLNRGGTLPLRGDGSLTIAVVGPNGGCGTSGFPPLTPTLCEAQTSFLGNYQENSAPPEGVSTLAASLLNTGLAKAVTYNRGCNIDDGNVTLIPPAVAAVSDADVALVVVGDSGNSCGEGRDRDDLDLPGGQLPLLQAVLGTGKPTVVVLIHCRTPTFGAASGNAVLSNVSALLAGWRPGSMGGAALSRLLFGAVNPSGKLPMSWIRSAGQANGPASPWLQERVSLFGGAGTGAEGRTYGSYTQSPNPSTPLFPFGFGLSYTTFSVTGVAASVAEGNMSYPLSVSLVVSNTGGSASGATVVQVYVQDPVGGGLFVRPWKRLLAFARTPVLPPSAFLHLTLPVRADDLAFYGDDMVLRVQSGEYTVSAGLDSESDDGPGAVTHVSITQSFVPSLTP